jgi:hypothetical protein
VSRRARLACALLASAALARVGAGADALGPTPTASPATRPAAGPSDAYLLHIPGIAGESMIDQALVGGLIDGGFGGPAEIYDWTGHNPGIAALVNRERNDQEAQKIADRVTAHRRRHPAATIMLTAHSGGTGLVVFALEKLPPDVRVDGVLLLSPALSPTYDLSKALARVTGRMYVFSSTMDVFVLGLGRSCSARSTASRATRPGGSGSSSRPTRPTRRSTTSSSPARTRRRGWRTGTSATT